MHYQLLGERIPIYVQNRRGKRGQHKILPDDEEESEQSTMTSILDSISRGLKASFLAQIVHVVTNAALLILLTRYILDPASYGLLQFALSILSLFQLVAVLGFPKSGAKYIAEYTKKQPSQVPNIIATTFKYVLVTTVLLGSSIVVFRGPISGLLEKPALVPFLFIGSFYVLFRSLTSFFRTTFQAFNRVDLSAKLRALEGISRIVFVVALSVVGFGTIGVLLGYVIALVLTTLVGGVVLYKRFYTAYPRQQDAEPKLSRRILEYSIPITITKTASKLDGKVDIIIVGLLINSTAVGYYVLAKQIVTFLETPASSLGFTISPVFGQQKAENKLDRAAQIYQTSLRYILLLYLPICIGLVLVARPAVLYVFGREYLGAVPVIRVFGLYVLVRAIHKITTNGLDYLGLARNTAVARGTTALSNVGLNLLLVPQFGVVGAAIATLITFSVYTVLSTFFLYREIPLDVGDIARDLTMTSAIALGMGVLVFFLLPHVTSVHSLLAVILLGTGTWAALATLSGVLDVRRVVSFFS